MVVQPPPLDHARGLSLSAQPHSGLREQALARTLTNCANALAMLGRRIGVLSEHHEQLTRSANHRTEQAIAGSTQLVIGELCFQYTELNQKLDAVINKLDQIHRLGCWWEEAKE